MGFDTIAGQPRAVAALRRALASGRTAHAYVFAGPLGVGKMTAALLLAQALVCERQSDDACGRCSHCLKALHGVHPDIYRIGPQGPGRVIPIKVFWDRETHEGLIKDLNLKPHEAARKVALIDDAHAMNLESANCLLKTLEEPPPNSVLILVTPRPDALPETIISRCQMIRFAPLPREVIRAKLEEQGVDGDTARFLSMSSGGSLGRAMTMAGESALPEMRRGLLAILTGLNDSNVFESAANFSKMAQEKGKSRAEGRTVTEWLLDLATLFYRDVAVRQIGVGEERLTNADVRELVESEIGISRRGIRSILDTIELAKSYIQSNVDVDAVVLDTFSRIAALRTPRAA